MKHLGLRKHLNIIASVVGVMILLALAACGGGGGGGGGGAASPAPGSLDASFGTNGIVTTPIGSSSVANAVAIQGDGRIVAAGHFVFVNGDTNAFAVARYNASGSPDTGFGTDGNGVVVTPVGSASASANALAVQSTGKIAEYGKIVAAGTSLFNGVNSFVLVRYNVDGSLDTGFGTNGIATTLIGSGSVANALAIQSDGRIVVAGFAAGATFDFAVARYNVNGTLDTGFGTNGIVTTPIGNSTDVANAVAIQSDGAIVVAGSAVGATNDFALARYNADGGLDTNFGASGTGIVTTPIGNGGVARNLAIQSDGKIVLAGEGSNFTSDDFTLMRYNADGSPDASFENPKGGQFGLVVTSISDGNDAARAIAIQGDGKIVAAGSSGSNADFALVRYNP